MIDQTPPIIAHRYAFIVLLMQEAEWNFITALTQVTDNDFWLQIAGILLLTFTVFLFLVTLYFYQLEHQKRNALEQAVSEVQVALYEWQIEQNLLIWVSGLMETFGYSESDIEPTVDWWLAQLHPDDKKRISEALEAAIKKGQEFSCEYRFRNADNRYLDIRGRANIISETPLRLVGSMEDVTEYKWAERAFRHQSSLYKALLQAQSDLGEGVATIEDEKIIYTNTALCHISNYTLEEIMSLPSFFDLMPPEERQKQRHAWQKRLMGKQTPNFFETVIVRRDGRQIDLEMAVKEIVVDERRQFILICRDITRRKRATAALRESERKYSQLVREAPDAIISLNQNGVIQVFNPAAERMSGYEAREMIGKRLAEQRLVAAPYLPKVEQEVALVLNGRERPPFELELVWQDGWRLTVEANPRRMQGNGQIVGVQLTLRDISERKAFEEQLAHHVFHDPLTSLPNRTLFRDRVDRALARTRRTDASIAVLVLDLDRFKVVNDSLGHSVGDQLLIKVARRLQECVQPEDTVARLGGDEFTILLEEVKHVTEAIHLADKIGASLANSFIIDGHEFFITTSIGIVISTERHQRPDDLLRDADVAMYRAKEHGKAQYEIFDNSMNASALERLELETALRQAIDQQTIEIYYQPLVHSPANGHGAETIVGMEALVRWPHPTQGLISPKTFIPLAEETGLIEPLGRLILAKACREVRSWEQHLPPEVQPELHVNLSVRQFQYPELVEDIAQVLEQTGFPIERLKLELTETILIKDTESQLEILHRLKGLGIKLAIDDFGTGWSSLSYIKRLPIDALKIDRSFIDGLLEDAGDQAIVLAVVSLADILGLQVISEGVENAAQMRLLNKLGCEIGQGYYFSKALPGDKMLKLLQKQST